MHRAFRQLGQYKCKAHDPLVHHRAGAGHGRHTPPGCFKRTHTRISAQCAIQAHRKYPRVQRRMHLPAHPTYAHVQGDREVPFLRIRDSSFHSEVLWHVSFNVSKYPTMCWLESFQLKRMIQRSLYELHSYIHCISYDLVSQVSHCRWRSLVVSVSTHYALAFLKPIWVDLIVGVAHVYIYPLDKI